MWVSLKSLDSLRLGEEWAELGKCLRFMSD